jgi:Phosphoesterase family
MRIRSLALLFICIACALSRAQVLTEGPVGRLADGTILLPTLQRISPAGNLLPVMGRPVDAVYNEQDGKLYVKEAQSLYVVDIDKGAIMQSLRYPSPEGASRHGLVYSRRQSAVYVSMVSGNVLEARVGTDGTLSWARTISTSNPASKPHSADAEGIAISPDERKLYVCLSITNELVTIILDSGKQLARTETGAAPYEVLVCQDKKKLYVSDWGGRNASGKMPTALSAGTKILIDRRGIARTGAISVVALDEDGLPGSRSVKEISAGLHPTQLVRHKSVGADTLYCTNANSDSLSVYDINTDRQIQTMSVLTSSLRGSFPNALTIIDDSIWAALGGENVAQRYPLSSQGLLLNCDARLPSGWFPAAICGAGNGRVAVISTKGLGPGNPGEHHNISDNRGLIQIAAPNAQNIAAWKRTFAWLHRSSDEAATRNRFKEAGIGSLFPSGGPGSGPIKHIVYILKENRTYDQILGDIGKGRSSANLAMYGDNVTPNHHAIASEFVLLDNYYCNGSISADGHSWAAEGNSSDHLEKAFGGFVRSYTFGDDPLTYSSTGFLWDNVVDHGLSFLNFGEMDYAEPEIKGMTYTQMLAKSVGKVPVDTKHKIGIDRLRKLSDPRYPGWNLSIPDQVRADEFIARLNSMASKGKPLPTLTLIYLPNDHTSGRAPESPTPSSMVADNDLALGRILEALSHSPYWSEMCVFVNEDDPQDGSDHVDGHRSLCLVAGPYVRRGTVVSGACNQTSVLHTMEALLGLPPMNQIDASSPVMAACFTEVPDFSPYSCRPPKTRLGLLNPAAASLTGNAQRMARLSSMLDFSGPDRADEDRLNAILELDWEQRTPARMRAGLNSGRPHRDDD